MKNKIYLTLLFVGLLITQYSCDLQKDPISDFSELTKPRDSANNENEITTKEQVVALRNGLYSTIRNSQENWYLDYLVYTEVHADNAYSIKVIIPILAKALFNLPQINL